MNLGKQFYVTLLLGVVGFTAFVYAEDSMKECNGIQPTETDEFMSIIKNALYAKNDFVPGRFIVLTDPNTTMNKHLRGILENENSTFVQFHRTFNNDIQATLDTAVLLSRINYGNMFIIHANSVNSAAQMYDNFTYILPDFIERSKRTFIVLTLLSEEQEISEKMLNKTKDELKNMKNTAAKSVKVFLFTKESPKDSVNYYLQPFLQTQYKMDNRLHRQSFNFSQHVKKLFNCGIQTMTQKLDSGMKNLSDSILNSTKYKNSIHNPHEASLLEILINCIRNVGTLTDLDSATDFFGKLDECKYREYTEDSASIKHFTGLDGKTIDSIFHLVDEHEFYQTIDKWRELLKNFCLKDNFKDQYQKADNGQLLPRNESQICIFKRNEHILRVTGIVVKMSDLKLEGCGEEPKVIEIFATEKVIIDKDISLIGRGIQMVIIAPIWEINTIYSKTEVIGQRRINLSGKNGAAHNDSQAKHGTKEGYKNGAHGRAGLPGGSAGNFYGIANEIMNAERLKILANGGSGGDGQHGGNGADGATGATYENIPKMNCSLKLPGWNKSQVRVNETIGNPKSDDKLFLVYYEVYGKKGKRGGNGGNGGIKGNGGQKGIATIVEFSNQYKNQFNLSALDGAVGKDGKGGMSGFDGSNGLNITVRITCISRFNWEIDSFSNQVEQSTITGVAKKGLDGISGTSRKRKVDAERLEFINIFPTSVNEYKIFLSSHLSEANSTEEIAKLSFYRHLNSHEDITKLYDTLTLVEDFIRLEKQFFFLHNKINFTPFYEKLENRIQSFKGEFLSPKTAEYKSIIDGLIDDINDRIDWLKSIPTLYPVNPNFKELDKVDISKNIDELKDFINTKNILHILSRSIYELEKNIKNGDKLIKDVIPDAISDIEDTLDENLDSILTEITELDKNLHNDLKKLNESSEKLKEIMRLKVLFGILKIGCGALEVINPALGLAGGIATSAITVLEAATTEDTTGIVTVLPKAVENLVKQSEVYFNEMKKKQEEVLKAQKEYITGTIKTTSKNEIELSNRVMILTKNFAGVNAKNSVVMNSKYLQQSYTQMELQLKAESIKENANPKQKAFFEKGLEMTKYLKTTSEAFKTGTETALSILKDKTKVDAIENAIEKNVNASKALHLIEEHIYNTVEPLLNDMKKNVSNVVHKVIDMDEFKALVEKWKITETIKNIQYTLDKVIKNFNSSPDMSRSFEKLVRTFDLLFDMHESLLEKKNYLKNKIDHTLLHIVYDSNFQVRDYHLKYALSELEVLQRSNYIAEDYHKWFSAFKQHIFPYSGQALNKLQTLDELSKSDINEFTDKIRNIDGLIKKVASTFNIQNKRLSGSICSDHREQFNFFVWKNDKIKNRIEKFLSGEKINLHADIQRASFGNRQAVKFNRINILLTTSSCDKQQKLNNELNKFNVKMTHSGNSKYKYGQCIYEINTAPITLEFNYDMNYTITDNNNVMMLNESNLLSPYASWSIQLDRIHDNQTFDSLSEFKNDVNLELIGHARFINKAYCDSKCVTDMRKYYKLVRCSK